MIKAMPAAGALLLFVVTALGVSARGAEPAPRKKAFIVSHFHCDPVWTNTQAGEIMRSLAIVHQQLDYARREPRFKFILSEIDYLEPYWNAYPSARAEILSLAEQGRIEFTGGYCEPDEAEVGSEALLRNFAYGKLFKESYFGAPVITAAQHDVFGHAVQMPQILLGTGHRFAQFSRGNLMDLPGEFSWLGPDGSQLLTKSIGYSGNASDASFLARDNSFYGLTHNAMFMSGGDFSEPDMSIGHRLKNTKTYSIVSGTHREFFEAVQSELDARGLEAPAISRDHTPLLVGCYTSRIETKWANRLVENLVSEAEKFATLDSLETGAPFPWAALDAAWRILFFGQHHDALPGTSTENVNLDLLTGWHHAARLARAAVDNALNHLEQQIDTASGKVPAGARALVLFNSLNWDRSDAVEAEITFPEAVNAFRITDAGGAPVAFQLLDAGVKTPLRRVRVLIAPAAAPSLGYTVLYAAPAAAFPEGAVPVRRAADAAETADYRIRLDPARGGGIVSLYAKKLDREFMDASAGVGNEIFAIKENAHKVEAPWSIHATGQVWRSGAYPAADIVLETGAVRDRLIVTNGPHTETGRIYDGSDQVMGEIQEQVLPALVQEIILYHHSARIDFATHMNGFEAQDLLYKVGFPAALPGTVPVFEERFAAVARERNTEDFLFYDFWREPGVKRGREYPAYNWVDLGPGAALSFEGAAAEFPLFAGEIVAPDGPVFTAAANDLARTLAAAGVTTTPTRDASARTNEYYGFRLALDAGGANAYTKKLLTLLTPAQRGAFNQAVADAGYAFLFMHDPASVTQTADARPIPILLVSARDDASLRAAVGKIAADLAGARRITLAADANLTALSVPRSAFGMTLINSGNPGNSVEGNNTMTLTLMRSITGWPAGKGYTENWETQHWNHRFRYALLPHAGDWQAAGAVRRGYEFNNPMRVVVADPHPGSLPGGAHSLLHTGDADVVVSSLKPAGFLINDKIVNARPGAVSLRMYNPGPTPLAGSVAAAFPLSGAWTADMLDRPLETAPVSSNTMAVSLAPFKINTYLLDTAGDTVRFEPEPMPAVENTPPQYVRYWETNENAAPQGSLPVSVLLEPAGWSADRATLQIRVTVANNMLSGRAAGLVTLTLPPGATAAAAMNYDLGPGEFRAFDVSVSGLDRARLARQFLAARVTHQGRAYEDVLRFSDWKISMKDTPDAAASETDDAAWEILPLARFWSAGDAGQGAAWFRKKLFVPESMGDIQMTFERPDDARVAVFINGREVRSEGPGLQYTPLVSGKTVRYGEDNLIAIRYHGGAATTAPAWANAFMGSEALFNNGMWQLPARDITLTPGQTGTFHVIFVNPFDQPVQGRALAAGPVETWDESGAYSLVTVSPFDINFKAGPLGSVDLAFQVSVPEDAMPGTHVAAVKIICHGLAAYTDTVHIRIRKP